MAVHWNFFEATEATERNLNLNVDKENPLCEFSGITKSQKYTQSFHTSSAMWSSILVAVCSVLLVLVFWLIEKRCRFRSLDQLPGPKGWPIFGSALEMGNNPTGK